MNRWRLFTLFMIPVLAMTVAADRPTDLLGDPLPEHAVQRLGSLRLRYGSIGDLAYLPDGRALVASGTHIDIWDMGAGEQVARYQIGSHPITGVHVRSDGGALLISDSAGNVVEWDLAGEEVLRQWATGQGRLASAYYSADGQRVLTCGGNPPTLKEWNLASGDERVFIRSALHNARQAVYGADDRSAYIHGGAGSGPVVAHYDLADGRLIHAFLNDFYTHTRSIALSPDRERLLVGSRTRATEWGVAEGPQLLNTFRGHHGGAVTAVAYAPDPGQLLTGSRDGSIRLWNRLRRGGEVVSRWFAHANHVHYILVSPNREWVMSYGGGNMVVEYGLTTGEPRLAWGRHKLGVNAVAFTPDGRVVSGSEDGTVRIWDMLRGESLVAIETAAQEAWAVAASPDGKRIAVGFKDGIVREFSATDGRLIRELKGHLGYIRALVYMPEPDASGPYLLSSAGDGAIRIWSRSGDAPLHVFAPDLFAERGHRGGVLALGISPDGEHLLSGGRDGTMRLWDLRTRALKATFAGHRGWVEAVAFPGNTGQALSASRDGKVRRWDLLTGALLAEMDHGSAVMGLACTGDGGVIIAGGADNAVSIWSADGERVKVMAGHVAGVNAIAVSPDNAHFVSASGDATLLVWEIPTLGPP